jgi:hypothetical protein
VTRILITGSPQGLGQAAATTLLGDGHQVVVHAATPTALADLVDRGAALVVGDLRRPRSQSQPTDSRPSNGNSSATSHARPSTPNKSEHGGRSCNRRARQAWISFFTRALAESRVRVERAGGATRGNAASGIHSA